MTAANPALLALGRPATSSVARAHGLVVDESILPGGAGVCYRLFRAEDRVSSIWLYLNFDASVHLQFVNGRVRMDDDPLTTENPAKMLAELGDLLEEAAVAAGW